MQSDIRFNAARLAGIFVFCASLAACGGGGSDAQTAAQNADSPGVTMPDPVSPAPATTPPVNHAPSITGSAPSSVTVGQSYNFVPVATDADGDTLQFAISSKPSWASFDPTTGRLSGVPTSASVGSFEEIEIRVTDGNADSALAQFAITVSAAAPVSRSVTLSWQPPTVNSDGSALTNLNGYRILYGVAPHVYTQSVTIDNAGLTRYVLENLQSTTRYYIAMVAVNSDGAQSDTSQEVVVGPS